MTHQWCIHAFRTQHRVAVSSKVPPQVLDSMDDLTMDPHESVTQAPCGLLPTWVDEASNPGPGDIRNARRLRSTQLDRESVEEGNPGAPGSVECGS